MPIETLKDALSTDWRVHARCIDGKVDNNALDGEMPLPRRTGP
jgi:hypothetical protein